MDAGSHFERDQLRCTFLSERDGIYEVKLTCDGKDLAAELIAAGLAAAAGPAGESAVTPDGASTTPHPSRK